MRQSRETLKPPLKDDQQPPSLSVDPKAWQPILDAQRPGRPDILAKMLKLHLEDSRKLVDSLLTALAERDGQALLESRPTG